MSNNKTFVLRASMLLRLARLKLSQSFIVATSIGFQQRFIAVAITALLLLSCIVFLFLLPVIYVARGSESFLSMVGNMTLESFIPFFFSAWLLTIVFDVLRFVAPILREPPSSYLSVAKNEKIAQNKKSQESAYAAMEAQELANATQPNSDSRPAQRL